MKKILILLLCISVLTCAGLITRPSYVLVGQLNWQDVLSKGYFVGSVSSFFTQGMIDESFYWVMKFSTVGLILGISVVMLFGGSSSKTKKKK